MRFRLLLSLIALCTSTSPAVGQPVAEVDAAENVIASFPISRDDGGALLPVKIGDKTYRFLVDTGATLSVLDPVLPLGRRLRSVNVKGAGGDIKSFDIHEPPPAKVGSLPLDAPQGVLVIDMTSFREVSGIELHGMIGMDFLRRYIAQFDPDAGELRFLKRLPANSGADFHLIYDGGRLPHLVLRLADNEEKPFMLDTGLGGVDSGTLGTAEFARLESRRALSVVGDGLCETMSGTQTSRLGRAKKMTLGDLEVIEPVFGESGANKVGYYFLTRFIATIDFPREKLYLKKGRRYAEPDLWNLSGLSVIRKNGLVMIHSVRKESVAAAAGLEREMSIEKVDGQESGKLSLEEIRRRCCRSGTLSLSVVRGDEKMNVRLKLER